MLYFFLGYFSSSKAYRVYNNRTMCLEEFIYVALEETQNDKIVEIIDHINESGQHLSLNVKTPIEANNNNNKKKQRPTNHKKSIRDSK